MRQQLTFNAMALRPGGSGVQTYIRQLLGQLPTTIDADLAALVPTDASGELPDGIRAIRRPGTGRLGRTLSAAIPVRGADLIHGLDVDLPLDLPRRRRAPTVITVHDLSAFDVPWSRSRLSAAAERRVISTAARSADAVIAVSDFTADRVSKLFGREAEVIPLAPLPHLGPPQPGEVERVRAAYRLPPRFVLHVGDIGPRKDVDTLAAACRSACVPLVLAGSVQAGESIPPSAVSLGRVAEADLAPLYGAATVVGYASVYEGFGLPVVEALACGAPAVGTRVPAVAELLGDSVETVPAGDVEQLAGVMRCLLADDDRRLALASAGRERASRLTWRSTAEATAAVYRSVGLAV